MSDSSSAVAVTLSLPPALEERVIDWLLAREDIVTFTLHTTYAHAAAGHQLSVAEQVSGRQRRVELRVELAAQSADDWLAALGDKFGDADVRYLVTPILRAGHLRRSAG